MAWGCICLADTCIYGVLARAKQAFQDIFILIAFTSSYHVIFGGFGQENGQSSETCDAGGPAWLRYWELWLISAVLNRTPCMWSLLPGAKAGG